MWAIKDSYKTDFEGSIEFYAYDARSNQTVANPFKQHHYRLCCHLNVGTIVLLFESYSANIAILSLALFQASIPLSYA